MGVDNEKSPNPSPKERKAHRRKTQKGSYSPGDSPSEYSTASSSCSSDLESDIYSKSPTAPTPTFGLKQKQVSVWKPVNHQLRCVCNYRAYRLVDTDQTLVHT